MNFYNDKDALAEALGGKDPDADREIVSLIIGSQVMVAPRMPERESDQGIQLDVDGAAQDFIPVGRVLGIGPECQIVRVGDEVVFNKRSYEAFVKNLPSGKQLMTIFLDEKEIKAIISRDK